ncbi:MAG: NPCBM/NEW2 domain-containing protein [Ruminococcus sp.]
MKRFSKSLVSIILAVFICFGMLPVAAEETASDTEISDSFVFLSDIDYQSASIGWGVLHLDGNMSDSQISLYVDGNRIYFEKGLTAHATSTLVYDISDYGQYNYFTSYIGVDASQGTKGNVIFHIYTSVNGSEWTEVYVSGELTAGSESEFVSIDISNANYLKLYVDRNGGNGNDHSTFADAKLSVNANGQEVVCDGLKTVEEYDSMLDEYRNGSTEYSLLLEDSEFEHMLLQRTFIKNAGYKTLSLLCKRDEMYSQIISWLLNDYEALSLYIIGGEPIGSYQKSLEVLYALYTAHGDDMNDSQYGGLYKKMMITLSLTHSEMVSAWYDSTQISDPVYRYEIYKELHSDGLLWNDIFENLTVEEMRWVLDSKINDDEIKLLNTYVRENNSLSEFTYENWCKINGYTYITYTFDYNYPEHPSIFDIFEQGAVCGGISKSSVNIRQVFGVPAAAVGQPGHCAWLDYRFTDNNSVCYLGNDVSGWTQSYRGEERGMPCGWGNGSWRTDGNSVSYVMLSQEALNDDENYKIAEELVALSDVFDDETAAICRKALEVQSFNLDAYYNLIMATIGSTQEDSLALLQEIENNMYGYPLPMWDLINLLKSSHSLNSDEAVAEFMITSYEALNKSASITSDNSNQPDVCKIMANSLLSNNSFAIAEFSLSGENANMLMLTSDFSENAVMEYSLDGGEVWISAGGSSVTLSDEQISALSTDKDILVRIEGMEKYYTIDVSKANSPSNLYNNDLENRVINATDEMEWSFDNISWTSFADSAPDLTGDKTVYVRFATNGTAFASDSVELSYTADEINLAKSYISLDKVSVVSCSTEASNHGEYAYKAIDGNINTYWHTNWTHNSDSDRYIIFELDNCKYLSAIDYVPRQDSGINGIFTACEVYTSLDGETWALSASADGWVVDRTTKTIEFTEPVYAKYVKVVGTQAYANFGSAAMINFYEDLTKKIGDVNSDGKIDINDATKIQMFCSDIKTLTEEEKLLGDVNGDGVVSIKDATEIQMYCALIIDRFSFAESR